MATKSRGGSAAAAAGRWRCFVMASVSGLGFLCVKNYHPPRGTAGCGVGRPGRGGRACGLVAGRPPPPRGSRLLLLLPDNY
jgi:hypothetical protein